MEPLPLASCRHLPACCLLTIAGTCMQPAIKRTNPPSSSVKCQKAVRLPEFPGDPHPSTNPGPNRLVAVLMGSPVLLMNIATSPYPTPLYLNPSLPALGHTNLAPNKVCFLGCRSEVMVQSQITCLSTCLQATALEQACWGGVSGS
jgi:hypothetical protein